MRFMVAHFVSLRNDIVSPRAAASSVPARSFGHYRAMSYKSPQDPNDRSRQVLKELMLARDMSVKDLAQKLGCSKTLARSLVNGNRRITENKRNKLGKIFGVPPDYIKNRVSPLDGYLVSKAAAGAVEALVQGDIVKSRNTPANIGDFIAQCCVDLAKDGELNPDNLDRYLGMLVRLSDSDEPSQNQ